MPSLIEMQYNPYLPDFSVLLNGKQPPDLSRLVQYSDEDLCFWYKDILDVIYSEIRDDFAVSFTGTPQDSKIIEYICKEHAHCRGFRSKEFVISTPLQSRMKDLNQYIKRENGVAYEKTIIDSVFMIPSQLKGFLEEINSIDITNLFCTVRISTIGLRSDYAETDNSFLFLITDESEAGVERIGQLNLRKPAFVFVIGDREGLLKVNNKGWYWGVSADGLVNAVFKCMLQTPLLFAFRKCINSLGNIYQNNALRKMFSVDPIVNVTVNDNVEAGKSVKIEISLDPPVGIVPKLVFKTTNMNVLTCDGLNVYGRQEGISDFEVYMPGDKKPFFMKPIKVYRRNRITKIIISDDSLLLGKGDKKRITCDYYPRDADNSSTISWKSSNTEVVRIDQNGDLIAVGFGNCRIICTAENVSAQCICTVKPYLEKIELKTPLEDDVLKLEPFQEITLDFATYPADCVDDKIVVTTSDFNAVNVVGKTLYAKIGGEAIITVKNISGRINETFKAVVTSGNTKKVGFFAKLFGKQ